MLLPDVCQSLQCQKVNDAPVGAYAVVLHGAVRGTVDIDQVVEWQ